MIWCLQAISQAQDHNIERFQMTAGARPVVRPTTRRWANERDVEWGRLAALGGRCPGMLVLQNLNCQLQHLPSVGKHSAVHNLDFMFHLSDYTRRLLSRNLCACNWYRILAASPSQQPHCQGSCRWSLGRSRRPPGRWPCGPAPPRPSPGSTSHWRWGTKDPR